MKPLVLVGETRSRTNLETLARLGWGRMFVTCQPRPFPYERWGFDNGAFGASLRGLPFPEDDFRRRLDAARNVATDPYLAVTPDIVGAGRRSLEFSLKWRMQLGCDWPWYLAVQDGMTAEHVQPHLHLFAGIFLGGTDRFKSTAYHWCQLAHRNLIKFHYGRASTPGKLESAYRTGSDSCDSAFPLWTQARMKTFTSRWEGLEDQCCMQFA